MMQVDDIGIHIRALWFMLNRKQKIKYEMCLKGKTFEILDEIEMKVSTDEKKKKLERFGWY